MPTADDIRDGIATALSSLSGYRFATREGEQVNPPSFKIGVPIPIGQDTYGTWVWSVAVGVWLQAGSMRAADKALAPLIDTDATSVIGLLYANKTLGGVVSDLDIPEGVSDIGIEQGDGNTTNVYATWAIEVWV